MSDDRDASKTTSAGSAGASPEELWAGEFGDAYVARNARLDERRARYWRELLATISVRTVLEVGCGQGGNLVALASILAPRDVWGIDINELALIRARTNAPGVNAVYGPAGRLPFRDRAFDLVFTTGVLIHQPDDVLPDVLDEIVRCSGRFVLCGEYHADEPEEILYRGVTGALFKRDYGRIYHERFPALRQIRDGYLAPEDGFDRLTWQLFEQT